MSNNDEEKTLYADESLEALSLDQIVNEEPNHSIEVDNYYSNSPATNPKISKQPKQPYKNMKTRKIVLLIGFLISFVGFALMAFSLVSLLVPNTFATIKLFIPIDIASCAASFVGAVFAIAGANTKKSIARLSFFFAILGFVISSAMLVIMYTSTLLPLHAIKF